MDRSSSSISPQEHIVFLAFGYISSSSRDETGSFAIKETGGGLPRICVSFWKKGEHSLHAAPWLIRPSGCRIPWILWAGAGARPLILVAAPFPLYALAFYGSYGPDFLADVRPLSKLISVRLLFVPDWDDDDDDEIGTSRLVMSLPRAISLRRINVPFDINDDYPEYIIQHETIAFAKK